MDHPYLVIHSDTQRDKGQDALALAGVNAAVRAKAAAESNRRTSDLDEEEAEVTYHYNDHVTLCHIMVCNVMLCAYRYLFYFTYYQGRIKCPIFF